MTFFYKADEITNQYLYGASTVPTNLVDPSIINTGSRQSVGFNVNEYMTSGPGRFTSAANIEYVVDFLTKTGDGAITLAYKEDGYTKDELYAAMGITGHNYSFHNIDYGINDPDFAERVYIWGQVAFEVIDSARFFVTPGDTGERYIQTRKAD